MCVVWWEEVVRGLMLTICSLSHAGVFLFTFHDRLRRVVDCNEARRRVDCRESTSIDGGET